MRVNSTVFALIGVVCLLLTADCRKSKNNDVSPVSDDKAKNYLEQFGYVAPAEVMSSGALTADLSSVKDVLKNAVRKFQEFAGLAPTGELDVRTKKKMAEPRCGVLDVQALSSGREAAFKWPKEKLTYTILSYSPDLSQRDASEAIQRAFDLWSEKSPLEFKQTSSLNADIKIKFASRDHGDPWPFDGSGGVLAHATMPTSGMLHFDEDENWVYMDAERIASHRYTDLFPVALHEIGHTLGLSHSRTEESIMAPFYQETVDENGNYVTPVLKSADVRAIQDIYGPRRSSSSSSGSGRRGGFLSGLFGFGSSRGSGRGDEDQDSGFNSGRRGGSGGSRDDNDDSGSGRGGWGGRSSFTTTTERPTTTTKKGLLGRLWSSWLNGGRGSSSRSRTRSSDSDPDSSGRGSSSTSDSGDDSDSRGFGSANCPSTLDAFTPAVGGVSYAFQGSKVFELRGRSIKKTHSLRLLFPNGPIYVEAAVVNEREQTVALFQSYNVYVFEYDAPKFKLKRGYPKRVNGFNPVGAIFWVDGHQFLFSRSGEFAVYDDYWNEVTSVNRVADYFAGFPQGVKGGYADGATSVTVFTTARVYRYDTARKATVGNSQSISEYLGC